MKAFVVRSLAKLTTIPKFPLRQVDPADSRTHEGIASKPRFIGGWPSYRHPQMRSPQADWKAALEHAENPRPA